MDNGNVQFIDEVSKVLARHPVLCYTITLNESHVPIHPHKQGHLVSAFCDVCNSYNDGLFESIRLMVRYEKSLMAWEEITTGMESGPLKDTVIMDYAYPTFTALCDIPNTFKDQLVRACVKLSALARGDGFYNAVEEKGSRVNWFSEMSKLRSESCICGQLCDVVENDLFRNPDARHFRDIHGARVHDLSPSLVSGLAQSCVFGDGVTSLTWSGPFCLASELEIIDRHRLRMQHAYQLFGELADSLYVEI